MTATDTATLWQASAAAGLDCRDAVLLRRHAATVYHLPAAGAVARITSIDHLDAAKLGVQVTRWLRAKGVPAAGPIDGDQPTVVGTNVVTFWRYYPQNDRELPPTSELARILRKLHALKSPPMPLPAYQPLKGFLRELARVDPSVLQPGEYEFLRQRADGLLHAYSRLESELGHGMIHGDPRAGNLLWDGESVLLGDWDSVSQGPRELDLVVTYQGVRYGRSEEQLDEFASVYGWDIRSWPGYATLRAIRDLHTLSAPLRLAAQRADIAAELRHRIKGLREADLSQQWRSL